MTLALAKVRGKEQRQMMREAPDLLLFPVQTMAIQFGFPPEGLRQELEAGRLQAVMAGIDQVPCVSWKSIRDWLQRADSPGVLVEHVVAHLMARKQGAN